MDLEEESEECDEEEGSEVDSETGVASLALATTFLSNSILKLEENDNAIYNIAPTYCFMAKGSKVPNDTSSYYSSDREPDDYKNPVRVNFLSLPLNNKLPWKSFRNC